MSSLNDKTGRGYWRTLAEYADSPEYRESLGKAGLEIEPEKLGVSRRRFLQIMGASLSLAGISLTGCRRWPEDVIAPFADRPDGRMPGEPEYYATMIERGGVAHGLLVENMDGRPIKIEGNPRHPWSLGATEVWDQASVLGVYDPERSMQVLMGRGEEARQADWAAVQRLVRERLANGRGEGLAVLSEPSDSPALRRMKQRLGQAYPGSRWYAWEPINRDEEIEGARRALGRAVRPVPRVKDAAVIACFDADPLFSHPGALRHARMWAEGRKSADTEGEMNRVYVAEPGWTVTGSVADERLQAKASEIPGLVRALAVRLGVAPGSPSTGDAKHDQQLAKLARDLGDHRGSSLVTAGSGQPAEVHALVWAINERLGNLGRTVEMVEPAGADEPTQIEQIAELTRRMDAGEVETLVILGGNPVYDAPSDLGFGEALANVETKLHLSLYYDETSLLCDWHLPRAHYLESWGDGRAWDGTYSVQQPQILPLFGGRSPIEVVAMLLDEAPEGYGIVREAFRGLLPDGADFETAWRQALHTGLVENSSYPAVRVNVSPQAAAQAAQTIEQRNPEGMELVFRLDPSLYDGRWANNGWLQELPQPATHLTWDNAAILSVADAEELGVDKGDLVRLTVGERVLEMPAYPVPGQVRGSVLTTLGYGREAGGRVGYQVGFDTYRLRTRGQMHVAPVRVEPTGGDYELATTTQHHMIDAVGEWGVGKRAGAYRESGKIVKEASLLEYLREPGVGERDAEGNVHLQLFEPPMEFDENHAWGMTVDMNACTGCNACVIACQAENNIPVVGKDQVLMSREMHWLRIDRYFKGDPEGDVDLVHQPMFCVHCENAPCEQVCPVNAAIHDSEGLNLQVYNRCIGTRYCSNNCPYKVRRFNFFDYHSKPPRGTANPWLGMPDTEQQAKVGEIERMVFNPDVTVRMRGVMEKCTYCVQRISRAKIEAKAAWAKGEREVPEVLDGELQTACQQACPTQVITFGDISDPTSRVRREQANPRSYAVLDNLNTRPRTLHMAKLRNPAEPLEASEPAGAEAVH